MRMCVMDDEGRDLMHAGIEMAEAALLARSRRANPAGIIEASYEMSRIKTSDIRRQLEQPPLGEFHHLKDGDRVMVEKLMTMFLSDVSLEERNVCWRKLRGYFFFRAPTEVPELTKPDNGAVYPPVAFVPPVSEKPAGKPGKMRTVRRTKSLRVASQGEIG